MKTIGERIRYLRHCTPDTTSGGTLTGAKLASDLGITQAYQSAIECGKRIPSYRLIFKYAEYFNVSPTFLTGGMPIPSEREAAPDRGESPTIFVPFIHNRTISNDNLLWPDAPNTKTSNIGLNMESYPDIETEYFPIWDTELAQSGYKSELRAMRAEGDSMEPQVHDRDIIIFRNYGPITPGYMYVVRLNGMALVKGLIFGEKDKPRVLRSTNRAFPDIVVGSGQRLSILGPVLRIYTVRRAKSII